MDKSYKENEPQQADRISAGLERFENRGDVLWHTSRRVYEWLHEHVPAGLKMLEVGCGIGTGTDLLAQKAAHITGIDIDQKAIAFARTLYSRPSFEVWDVTVCPFQGRWDLIVSIEVIEHIAEYGRAIAAMLATAPYTYLSTPNRQADELPSGAPSCTGHVREFTPNEMAEQVRGANGYIESMWDLRGEKVDAETKESPIIYLIRRSKHG